MPLVRTEGVLLRAHAFGDTSRVLRFYTRDLGLAGVMARGVRARGGRVGSGLSTFAEGELEVYVKPTRELHTFKDFSCTHPRSALAHAVLRFAAASTLAELVMSHAGEEPNELLFRALHDGLTAVEQADASLVPNACLSGLWGVVAALGYRPVLDRCVACGRPIEEAETARFDHAAGGVRCSTCGQERTGPRVGPVARAQISALLGGIPSEPVRRPRGHLALLSDFIAHHVAGKRLGSVSFLSDLLGPRADRGDDRDA